MIDTPDTSGSQPKAEYVTVKQVVAAQAVSTQASSPQVRTVPTRMMKGNISLRYAPLDQGPRGDMSTDVSSN